MNVFNLILWRHLQTMQLNTNCHSIRKRKSLKRKTAHVRTTYKLQLQLLTMETMKQLKHFNFTCSTFIFNTIQFVFGDNWCNDHPKCILVFASNFNRVLSYFRVSVFFALFFFGMVQKRFLTLYSVSSIELVT